MSRKLYGAVVGLAAASLLMAACSSNSDTSSAASSAPASNATAKVGVILPDAASSARWETADR